MDPYGPPRKRPRADAVANGNGNGHHAAGPSEMECRRFNTPEGCPYGDSCRFRHVPSGGPAALASEKDSGAGSGSRTKPCTKFFSTSGCPYGEGCHFLHFVPGGIAALGLSPLGTIGSSGTYGSGAGSAVRKVIGGVGPSGAPAPPSPSDQGANLGGFKTRLCNRYDTPEGCRFGDKCHFAHGEKELRKANGTATTERDPYPSVEYPRVRGTTPSATAPAVAAAAFRAASATPYAADTRFPAVARDTGRVYGLREPTPPGLAAAQSFGASSTAKISIEASLAGAIIGKGGVNAKQICRLTGAKLSIREHESDPSLRNVEMEGSFEQIKQASQMVRQVLMHRDNVPAKPAGFGSHNYKTKLCENFAQGTCTFGERCHFAHGANELRENSLRA